MSKFRAIVTLSSKAWLASVIKLIGFTVFTGHTFVRKMRIIIREVVMIERELGNWKDFIEVMLRK